MLASVDEGDVEVVLVVDVPMVGAASSVAWVVVLDDVPLVSEVVPPGTGEHARMGNARRMWRMSSSEAEDEDVGLAEPVHAGGVVLRAARVGGVAWRLAQPTTLEEVVALGALSLRLGAGEDSRLALAAR